MSDGGATRRSLLALLGVGLTIGPAARALAQAAAAPSEVAALLPAARLLGSGTLRFLALPIYDARLWAGEGFDPQEPAGAPLALELVYRRALDGARIAERSLVEMQRVAGIGAEQGQRWLVAMQALFPDVRSGDRLTGLHLPGAGLRFFLNAKPIGELRDPEFARRFLAIWLGPNTSEPALRRALLGLAP